MSKYNAETGEFKGNKVITLSEGEKRVVSFGLRKAKAILENIEAIKKFVEENDSYVAVDTSKLSPEQQQLIQSFITK